VKRSRGRVRVRVEVRCPSSSQLGVSGSVVSSPSRVWGGSPPNFNLVYFSHIIWLPVTFFSKMMTGLKGLNRSVWGVTGTVTRKPTSDFPSRSPKSRYPLEKTFPAFFLNLSTGRPPPFSYITYSVSAFMNHNNIYVKNCSVYIQCKGDIVVVDIKQHKSQFTNSNITITQSAKFFWHCVMVMFEFLNCDLCCFISTTTMSPLHCI